MADNTVFDSVFKTMVHRSPQLMIPFINEVFGRSYPQDSPIIRFSDEHESLRGTIIDDTVFRLAEKIYHVECQSTPDSNMVVRMIEYDFHIALEEALSEGEPYELDYPASCVLYLRHTSKTPDALRMKVNLPDGSSFQYETKIVKAQQYSSEEIFTKKLLLLLPYYLMRYERNLASIASDNQQSEQLVHECASLRTELESTVLRLGDTPLYEELVELIIKVSDHLLAAHEALQKKVRKAMGGEVLELWRERAERLEREAEARGIAQGMEQGLEQGLEQGREQGLEQGLAQGLAQGREQGLEQGLEQGIEQGIEQGVIGLAGKLRELGVDEQLLEEAFSLLKDEGKKK